MKDDYSVEEDAFYDKNLSSKVDLVIDRGKALSKELHKAIDDSEKTFLGPAKETDFTDLVVEPKTIKTPEIKPMEKLGVHKDIELFRQSSQARLDQITTTRLYEHSESNKLPSERVIVLKPEQTYNSYFPQKSLEQIRAILTALKYDNFQLTGNWYLTEMRDTEVVGITTPGYTIPDSPYNYMNERCFYKVFRDHKGTIIIINMKDINSPKAGCFSITFLSEGIERAGAISQITYAVDLDDDFKMYEKVRIIYTTLEVKGITAHALSVSKGQVIETAKVNDINESRTTLQQLNEDLKRSTYKNIPRNKLVEANEPTISNSSFSNLLRRASLSLKDNTTELALYMIIHLLHQNRNS